MNPVTLVIWAMADNLVAVVVTLAALALVCVTLAIHEHRHPFR